MDEIRRKARERAQQLKLPYAGALLPVEAHGWMQAGAILVDVRTKPELDFVGSIPGAIWIEWNSYPDGRRNPRFLEELAQKVPKDAPVMFCAAPVGARINAALAATQAGWQEAYNVLEGFEGDKDPEGHRGTLGGWRKAGLPWTQG